MAKLGAFNGRPARSCSLRVLLGLLLLAVSNARSLAGVQAPREQYLLPIMPYGPCNQIAALKEVLVLGKLLGRTVILHQIFNHWTDGKYQRYKDPALAAWRNATANATAHATGNFTSNASMPARPPRNGRGGRAASDDMLLDFDELYSRRTLGQSFDVVPLDKLRTRPGGWNGSLDALLYLSPKHFLQMERLLLVEKIDVSRTAYLHTSAPLNCSTASLDLLRSFLARYDVVGALVYEEVVPNSGHNVKLYRTGDLCHDTYLDVSAKLVKSNQVVAWADAFVSNRMANETFVAVHIRPYPDSCLTLWEAPVYDPVAAAVRGRCVNRNLFNIAANHTVMHMAERKATVLFVVAHPLIRATVNKMYASVGLTPLYFDMSDLEAKAGKRVSVTLLSMVESEVAVRAAVFVGTPQSSMSGMIMQERASRRADKLTTLFFPRTTVRARPAHNATAAATTTTTAMPNGTLSHHNFALDHLRAHAAAATANRSVTLRPPFSHVSMTG